MQESSNDLILVGDSAFAEIAYEYFSYDSPYNVVAFAVERNYLRRDRLFGVPVVAVEDVLQLYPPNTHKFYAALVYTQKNRLRARLYLHMKALGYSPVSYISPRANIWRNAQIGEHAFIFEGNTIQPFVSIGDNTVLWSGNHIGHHSSVGSHCFISSQVVISGYCQVGDYTFMGVNATVANNVVIGASVTVGAGALVLADVPDELTAIGTWSKKQVHSIGQ